MRGDGGYVVAPPSIHSTGKKYEWQQGKGLEDALYGIFPDIILKTDAVSQQRLDTATGSNIGTRNNDLTQFVGSCIARGKTVFETLELAQNKNKHNKPPLPDQEVKIIVDSIYKRHLLNHPEQIIVDTDWPDILPLNDNAVLPKFPVDVLPEQGRKYVSRVAEVNQVDSGLAGSIYLSVLSTCLAKKTNVDLETHKEPLNLYIVSIAESGERKSSTVGLLTKPLYEYQEEQQDASRQRIAEALCEQDIRQKRLDKLKRQATNADEEDARRRLHTEIVSLIQEIEENPVPTKPVLLADDVTTEALGVLMAITPAIKYVSDYALA